ncbi:MAG TPA: enoyl-CoA hydratase-related protein [Acidimicrobiales bacterium]|jgi:enoyl-CoA hydratase|nr:enoyl-CoA hydratase-related protein [Acidimicrobiales bacterium]
MSSYDEFRFLDVTARDGIVHAELTHPDYDHAERLEWGRLFAAVADDPDSRVLVLSGWSNPRRGHPGTMFEDFDAFRYYDRALKDPVIAMLELDTPIVVALDGNPGVLTIPLSGDYVIAEEQLSFSDNHVKIGTASATQPFLCAPSMGLMRAKRHILTGRPFTAQEAVDMGLMAEVVPTGQALGRAMEVAEEIAALRPEAVAATKRNLNQWLLRARQDVFAHGLALEFMLFPADFAEAQRRRATGA